MNVNELKVFVESICNKSQTGNNMTPDEFNSYLARANEDKFRIETGLREVQTPVYFQSNQVSTDALRPFIKTTVLSGNNGSFTLPADYGHAISLATNDSGGRRRIVTLLNVDDYDAIIGHPVKPPSNFYPYATQRNGNTVEVSPTTVTPILLYYLSVPVTPFWAYTISQDTEVYDPANSIQMAWSDIYQKDIAVIIINYLGAQWQDSFLLQYGMKVKSEGS